MTTQNDASTGAPEAAKTDAEGNTHVAVLVHGKNYFLQTKHFKQGEEVKVTEAEKDYLEEHAVDPVDVTVGDEVTASERQKFEFRKIGEAPAPKARRRAA